MRSETLNANLIIRLALTSLKARGRLINDVNAALATDELAVTMTGLERFKRVLDLHVNHRSCWPVDMDVIGRHKNRRSWRQLITDTVMCLKGWLKYTKIRTNVNSCT